MLQGNPQDISSVFPITVIVAIGLFFVKECAELIKRRRERSRKLRAIKLLMRDEIERNHWAFKVFFNAVSALGDPRHASFRLRVSADGKEHYEMLDENGELVRGAWLPRFHDEQYTRLLLPLAELKEDLFDDVRDLYTEIAELDHYRNLLLSVLQGEDVQPDEESAKWFLVSLAEERERYVGQLSHVYRLLTGTALTRWRLW